MARDKSSQRVTLTVTEAAEKLGICRNSAYEAAKRGEIPTIKIGRLVLVPVARLDQLLSGGAERQFQPIVARR